MKTVKLEGLRACFQGDILIRRAKGPVPAGAKEILSGVVAHSETGHHHVVLGGKAYATDNSMLLHVVAERAAVQFKHLRDFDTHETIEVLGTAGDVYEIIRQREHTPEGWRRVED